MKKFTVFIREHNGRFSAFLEELDGVGEGRTISEAYVKLAPLIEAHIISSPSEKQMSPEPKIENAAPIDPYPDKTKKIPEAEAAQFLGISKSTLSRHRAAGSIGAYHWQRKSYYSIQQLLDFQEKHEIRPIVSGIRRRRR